MKEWQFILAQVSPPEAPPPPSRPAPQVREAKILSSRIFPVKGRSHDCLGDLARKGAR
jgi:hypothetical protein